MTRTQASSRENGKSALRYHDATKHSELSLRSSGHYLDWDNRPSPFKAYINLPSIPLPHNFPQPKGESLSAIAGPAPDKKGKTADIETLAEILFFSAGLTRKMKFGSELHYMRAASATGALYPIELYVINSGIRGLEAGVYHFNSLEFALVRIREGDHNSELANATDDATALSPVTIAFTSLAWRNAWKYQERSYRHWFWDSGVIAANLLATCNSENLSAKLVLGFVDTELDRLLGLEEGKEASVALAAIGEASDHLSNRTRKPISQLRPETRASSREEVGYPIIWETNRASQLPSQSAVKSWRDNFRKYSIKSNNNEPTFDLRSSKKDSSSLNKVILQRGSTRRFAQRSISFEALSTIIDASSTLIPTDYLPDSESLTEFYFIANDVEGLSTGSYYFDRGRKSLTQLKQGKLRYVSGYLALEQLLFSDASVVFFLMSDLNQILSSFGDRGYRAAQFEAGIRAGKIYLSSYAQGLGASGSTFYDDAVTEFFSPHAKGKSTMIVVGVGVPAYKAGSGKVLPQFPRVKN